MSRPVSAASGRLTAASRSSHFLSFCLKRHFLPGQAIFRAAVTSVASLWVTRRALGNPFGILLPRCREPEQPLTFFLSVTAFPPKAGHLLGSSHLRSTSVPSEHVISVLLASAVVAAMLRKSSILWPSVQQLRLTINERVRRLQGQDQQQQAAFADYLLQVGEGREPTFPDIGQDVVRLKDSMCLPCDSGVSALVQRVYGNVQQCSDPDFLMERSILAPRNVDVEDINSYMLHRWAGQVCHEQLWLHQQALCRPMCRMESDCVFL